MSPVSVEFAERVRCGREQYEAGQAGMGDAGLREMAQRVHESLVDSSDNPEVELVPAARVDACDRSPGSADHEFVWRTRSDSAHGAAAGSAALAFDARSRGQPPLDPGVGAVPVSCWARWPVRSRVRLILEEVRVSGGDFVKLARAVRTQRSHRHPGWRGAGP